MQKRICIPGASLVRDKNDMVVHDKRGRPLWNMPKPDHHVKHFNNAGARAAYDGGTIGIDEATHLVPVYRGGHEPATGGYRDSASMLKGLLQAV